MVHVVSRSARRFVAGVVVVGLLVGVTGIRTASARAPLGALGPTRFVVVPPCRLLDTRPANALDAGQEVELDVAGECGVPAAAVAAALTVTVTATGDAGHATVYPADVARPEASTTNWDRSGQTRANTALVRLSDDGAVRIWVAAATDLVVDVAGAFVPATTSRAGRYVPIAPRRVVDTRSSAAPQPGGTITVALPVEVAPDALALAVNITLTETTGFDFVAAYPAGSAAPPTSVLNADAAGQTRAAGAVVPVSSDGITIAVAFGSDVIVDVVGYFTGRVGSELERRAVRAGDADASARHALGGATALRPWGAGDRRGGSDRRTCRRGGRQLDAGRHRSCRMAGDLPVAHPAR